MNNFSTVFNHLWMSLLPCAIALIPGVGLGLLCAHVVRMLTASRPALRRWAILFPWRTLLLAFYPLTWGFVLFALIRDSNLVPPAQVGLTIFLLSVAFTATTLLDHWHSTTMPGRIIGVIRTCTALSLALAIPNIIPFTLAESGIGLKIFSALGRLQFQEAIYWWLNIVALILFIDLLLGILEFVMVKPVPQSG